MENLKKEENKILSENQEETPKDKEEEASENQEETPKDKEEEASENQEEIKEETTEEKLSASHEKLLRVMAEMENQRRRFEKEKKEAFEFGGFNFAGESLALIDNIDRAITSFLNDESLKNNKDLNKIIDSIEIIKKDLISIFKKNGVEAIDCINKKFDPHFHQAMLEVENGNIEAGIVVQEIQKGYMMKSRLLRPSLVGVSKKNEKKSEKK